WDAYLFASADQRYVAHNVFLDTDDELYRIERRPWVRDYRAGATLRIRWLRLQFVQTFRSPEFRPESRRQSFGTWLITVGASP
ncbi:MAG TPA: lipid A-modifier LpxR family protein, partial [Thermoanaerobaculia bacterium]|nr:lipid A-modifier LpxR family protein [Thermoanaerobaculia bacterium]